MGLPERLKEVQNLMAKGDDRAARIYETIGVYFGYTIPVVSKNSNGVEDLVGKRGRGEVD
jgi:hypothetical protein